jgi:hypothetical protein
MQNKTKPREGLYWLKGLFGGASAVERTDAHRLSQSEKMLKLAR